MRRKSAPKSAKQSETVGCDVVTRRHDPREKRFGRCRSGSERENQASVRAIRIEIDDAVAERSEIRSIDIVGDIERDRDRWEVSSNVGLRSAAAAGIAGGPDAPMTPTRKTPKIEPQ